MGFWEKKDRGAAPTPGGRRIDLPLTVESVRTGLFADCVDFSEREAALVEIRTSW